MSIFGNIFNKIFHYDKAAGASSGSSAPSTQSANPVPIPADQRAIAPAQPDPAPTVDVGAVLDAMAAMTSNGGGNYQSSIVDLLKLLDLDSSLLARKELADELGVHVGENGTAEQNIALHRAVMQKLADNGGVVPDSLRQ